MRCSGPAPAACYGGPANRMLRSASSSPCIDKADSSHIHLSVTRSGLDIRHGVWRDIFFKKHAVKEVLSILSLTVFINLNHMADG